MKQEEMQKYEVKAEAFWSMAFWGYDGYDMMEMASKKGWHAIAGWGKQGWDLGSWPLVIVFKKRVKGVDNPYLVAVYVEGDVTQYFTLAELQLSGLVIRDDRFTPQKWSLVKQEFDA